MLADFVIESTILEEELRADNLVEEDLKNQWVLYMDGSSNANGSRTGLILASPERDII